jgi:hypothetical protein
MSAVSADGCGGFVGILIFVFLFEQKIKKVFFQLPYRWHHFLTSSCDHFGSLTM